MEHIHLWTENLEKFLDFNVIHVAQGRNSTKMELAGLKLFLTLFELRNVTVGCLTTEWHWQATASMEKEKPNINHQFDIWYVGKNMKKLVAEAKKVNDRT